MIRRSTFVFLFIFIVLAGAVFYLQRSESKNEEMVLPTEENPLLFHFIGEIKGLSIEHTGLGKTELTKINQGSWEIKNHESEEANVPLIESGIGQLSSLRIASSLGTQIALKDAGLEPPVYVVKITFDDGSESNMIVGKETPTGSGYYVRVDGGEVVVVNAYNLDPFLKLADEPPVLKPATPLPDGDSSDLPLVPTPNP